MKLIDITDMVKDKNVSFNDIKSHIITESKKPNLCEQCNKEMNPVDYLINSVCMPCTRKNHKAVTG